MFLRRRVLRVSISPAFNIALSLIPLPNRNVTNWNSLTNLENLNLRMCGWVASTFGNPRGQHRRLRIAVLVVMMCIMRRYGLGFSLIWLVAAGCSGSSSAPQASSTTATTPTATAAAFSTVQPLLTANCVKCHGAQNPKAGIDLTSYASVMKGGTEGPIVKPGDPKGSKLVMALRGDHAKLMPMGAPPLGESDIAKFETWIKDGAKE
jgi:uncharacterized membrane protein